MSASAATLAAACAASVVALVVALEPVRAASPALPAPSSPARFDFSAALPPPPAAPPASPAPAAPAEEEPDRWRRVRDRARDPAERNVEMGHLVASGDPRAVDTLLAIATDPDEREFLRSWAVQHLGQSWAMMDDARRTRVRATLAGIVAQGGETDLPQREALYALACSDRAEERALAAAAVDAGLGDDREARLDLLVRLAGELGLVRHRRRALALTAHPSVAVAGAAREAVERLDRGGEP